MTERVRQGGFRPFRVVDKVRESSVITSFYLEPADAAGWLPFEAGQFLVLRIPEDGPRRAVPRSYSVSSSPLHTGRYRITIKREAAPAADLPNGIGSCWLHDRIGIGDTITASGPRGEFVLDRQSPRPVVLLSGGVGLTPMVSMLHALAAEPQRLVQFIHACDNGDVHALRGEVLATAASRTGISTHFCYRFPTDVDRTQRRHQSEGVITDDLLTRLLAAVDHDIYMCGPPPFMKAVYGLLRARGIPKERIAYEFFGPATVLEADVTATEPIAAPSPAQAKPPPSDVTVSLRRSSRTLTWDPKAHSLLDHLEAQGLRPDFSCRTGLCATCKTRLVSGEVTYFEDPLDPVEPGHVLICCSRPNGPIVLDL